MLVKILGASPVGINAVPVTIEVHAIPGFDFKLVGLPDTSVKESHDRILSALMVNRFEPPRRMFTINMAPADIKKEGASYDLPLAIGMLAGEEKVKTLLLQDYMIMGELSLDGSLQPIRGVLPIALCAKSLGLNGIILPVENAEEAAVVEGLKVYGMRNLMEVVDFLNGDRCFEPVSVDTEELIRTMAYPQGDDFCDVRGQQNVRRAMEVAAAGGHNMIMVGPPGAGKSMMAKRLPTILPPLSLEEALETTKIHSVAGGLKKKLSARSSSLVVMRPFRSPHHTISDVGLCGGGNNPHPGEISLAHNGVLFLDELPEFHKRSLEVLRQPLEEREITVTRNQVSVSYPASFMLVAAMNPCPCGYYGAYDPVHPCTCTPGQIHRYMSKISGPLLDRIDIQCPISAVTYDEMRDNTPSESSQSIRERVIKARDIQKNRYAIYNREHATDDSKPSIYCNAQMTSAMIRQYCALDEQSEQLLKRAMIKFGLSARAHDRVLKVARTIADLEGSEIITSQHLLEAIGYRDLDKKDYENH